MNKKRLLIASTICFVIVFLALAVWSKADAATKMTYTSGFDTDDDGKVDVLDLSTAGFVKTDANGVPSSTIELATPTHAGAPTANDDTGDGYVIGSLWTDSTTGCSWIAKSVGAGAAVWINQCLGLCAQNYLPVGNASGVNECTNTLPLIADLRYRVGEVIKTASATLTLTEVASTLISNYGETDDADLILTLPDLDTYQGSNFIYRIETAMATNDTCVKAAADNAFMLAGAAGADNGCICNAAPAVGDKLTCVVWTNGASTVVIDCEATRGTWAIVADATGDCPD